MRFNLFQKSLISLSICLILFISISIINTPKSSSKNHRKSSSQKLHNQIRDVYLAPIASNSTKIGIVLVVTQDTDPDDYRVAIDSLKCYAKAQGYDFVLTDDSYVQCDQHKDKFFRRHCVIANILPNYKAILFLDADIGVVNPKIRIEDFLTDDVDVYFYDRFYNWEIATGAYIVKNTRYGRELISGLANYEFAVPDSFHGSDNGALHIYLAEKLLPDRKTEINVCREAYKKAYDFDDLFTYEACIRALYGAHTDFGRVRIMKKGEGFVRDSWLTSGTWSPERDFMLHGFKTRVLQKTPDTLVVTPMHTAWWYNPYGGAFDMERCFRGNTTWSFDARLIKGVEEVNGGLARVEMAVVYQQMKALSRIHELVGRKSLFYKRISVFLSWFSF